MNNENINFVDFIKKYNIRIPVIQRDYVQGRKNETEIRKNFVKTIFTCLRKPENLNLEFIYGNIQKDSNQIEIFEPIDGQQRLTTLYLVTLFIALKEEKLDEIEKLKKRDFTYKVRNSSTEFCTELKNKLVNIPDENIDEYIRNQIWYDEDWKNDQTVESMLEMLRTIQKEYKETDKRII